VKRPDKAKQAAANGKVFESMLAADSEAVGVTNIRVCEGWVMRLLE
jgi:hypothetical protein